MSLALLERCPSCRRLFAGKLVRKELADVKEHRSQKLSLVFTNEYHYRCKHCGHEWFVLKTSREAM